MLNCVILIGRLVRDTELRYTTSGVAIGKFTIAVDRQFAKDDQQKTDFIDIVTFQKTAESCAKYLTKGSLCAVEGRIQIRSYEDKEGIKRKASEVAANNVRFLSPKKDSNQTQDGNTAYQEPPEDVHVMTSFDDDDGPPF